MIWRRWIVGAAVVIALFNAFLIGKRSGEQEVALKANADSTHVQDSVVRKDSAVADSVKHSANILTTYRSHVREKIVVRHDTILVRDSVVVVSPEVAQLIQADDSTIAALRNVIAAQDTLIAALRKGVALRDNRIVLLEKERNPGKLRGIVTATKWLAIGAVIGVAYSQK